MGYLAIFMTPHLKQQERNNGVWGLGWGGGSVIYLGGGESRISFKRMGGGSSNVFPPHENVTGPPPSNK